MEWIDSELKQRDWPRAKLLEAVPTWTETKISLTFSGQRKLLAEEADAIRRFFGYHLPDDPPDTLTGRIQSSIARLDASQKLAVALYLEALQGAGTVPQQAS